MVISGPCIPDPGDIECIFGDQTTKGKFLSDRTAFLCTTPELQKIGRIPFSIVVHRKNGEVFRGYTSFQSGTVCYHVNMYERCSVWTDSHTVEPFYSDILVIWPYHETQSLKT